MRILFDHEIQNISGGAENTNENSCFTAIIGILTILVLSRFAVRVF